MEIKLEIGEDTIVDMMVAFIESRDPVTYGWLEKVERKHGLHSLCWYSKPGFYAARFEISVVENDDGKKRRHRVTNATMAKGLEVMARKYPHHFQHILANNTDSACADLFMQCVVFGEEKYA